MSEFPKFPKIPRLHRDIIITEKIDGTNGLIEIKLEPLSEEVPEGTVASFPNVLEDGSPDTDYEFVIRAGSRNRWLSIDKDNYGFATWVSENAEELAKLGPGRHYGEWFGKGIQRGYGLNERRFALFNTSRWYDRRTLTSYTSALAERIGVSPERGTEAVEDYVSHLLRSLPGVQEVPTGVVTVVPVLHVGPLVCDDEYQIEGALEDLRADGSIMVPGYDRPEGIVVYHTASNHLFKVTLENDEQPKGVAA